METSSSRWPLVVAVLVIALVVFVFMPWYLGSLERVARKKEAKRVAVQSADVNALQTMAGKGDTAAQLRLGQMCQKGGPGVERDYAEAYKWLTIAAARGSKPAAILLDQLIPIMTPEQIAGGKERVAAFVTAKAK